MGQMDLRAIQKLSKLPGGLTSYTPACKLYHAFNCTKQTTSMPFQAIPTGFKEPVRNIFSTSVCNYAINSKFGLDSITETQTHSNYNQVLAQLEKNKKTFKFMYILFMPHNITESQITYNTTSFALSRQHFWFVTRFYFNQIDIDKIPGFFLVLKFDFFVVQSGDIFQLRPS